MNKIAIIITSFLRDDLLHQCIQSLMQSIKEINGINIIIVDQNPNHIKNTMYSTFCTYIPAPYNCGLSVARNLGVLKAIELECKYTVISADSIVYSPLFIQDLVKLTETNLYEYDLLGLPLLNRLGWEANITLIESKGFELNFIEKHFDKQFKIVPCEIVRNFFVATTASLGKVNWDVNLKMREHEDFFWRYKLAGYKVGCTNIAIGDYIGVPNNKYYKIRSENMQEGLRILREKYKFSGWVTYVNLNNAHEGFNS